MKRIMLLQLCIVLVFILSVQGEAVRRVKRKKTEPKKTNSLADKSDSLTDMQSNAVIIDDFGAVFTWKKSASEESTISSSKVPGKFGSALEIEYDLAGDGEWVSIEKFFKIPEYKNFKIVLWVKATGNMNTLEFKLINNDNSTFGYKVPLETNRWQKISVEKYMFTYWWGGDRKQNQINRINFAISPIDGGEGTVVFDRMTISPAKTRIAGNIVPGLLDGFEAQHGWVKPNSPGGTRLILNVVKGKNGDALKLSYDLGTNGEWVSINKEIDFSKHKDFKIFKFWTKASGNLNRLEFKVIDKDGSVFGKKYEWIESSWGEIRVSKNDLMYWWGGDNKMNEIEKIEYSISNIDGGRGAIYLDELGYE